MSRLEATNPKPSIVNIVSCDIVGHGFDAEHDLQADRIRELNEIIRKPIDQLGDRVIWASGGDGGHVAFLDDAALPDLLNLMRELRAWSDAKQTRLRLTVHRGSVSLVRGADGRRQLVGDGVNLCGSLVSFGSPHNYVVTSAFRDFVTERTNAHGPPVFFGHERTLYLKHFEACLLYLMGFEGDALGPWEEEHTEQRSLREARIRQHPWQMIYHMKRLLQVDSADRQASKALDKIQPRALRLKTQNGWDVAHPLLAFLSRTSVRSVIDQAELVERSGGDVICKRHDTGDSMFIVLRGEIGVVTGRGQEPSDPGHSLEPYDIRVGEGGIVGELALALNRPRTATLQAVGPTAFLSINYKRLEHLLARHKANSMLVSSFEAFLVTRILEHIYRNANYLSLYDSLEESASDPEPWERLLDESERLVIEPEEAYEIAFGNNENLNHPGLYILASGGLIEKSEAPAGGKRLAGKSFDILFADIPGGIIQKHHEFKIDPLHHTGRITIIRISTGALTEFAGRQYRRVVESLRVRLAEQMLFDAFISYAGENEAVALQWREGLELQGLRVYTSDPNARSPFIPEIDVALAESRVFLPIISRDALESEWVRLEISKRLSMFDPIHSNILPVALEDGLAERMELGDAGLPPIIAGRRGHAEAIREASQWIHEVRDGIQAPPFKSM